MGELPGHDPAFPGPHSELRGHSQFSAQDREPGPPRLLLVQLPTQVRRLLGWLHRKLRRPLAAPLSSLWPMSGQQGRAPVQRAGLGLSTSETLG